MDQAGKAETFRALHVKGDPLVLFNIWDPGSAAAVAAAGAKALATGSAAAVAAADAKALATGSWSVAAANGFADGEAVPFELVLANLRRIASSTDLPVSLDLERGYGAEASQVQRSVEAVIAAGAVGVNIEDGLDGALRPMSEQAGRIAAARRAAEAAGVRLFVNARTDVFLQTPPADHGDAQVETALERARVYAEAGADGVFAPLLAEERLIERFCADAPLPVNLMHLPQLPPRARLAELGVARISHGPGPYRAMVRWLQDAAAEALA